jgi:protein-L-isoaspartate(D-aspartate) O-methyltransferase
MFDHAAARAQMVDRQIARRGLTDARVLAAMREVPREMFVPESLAAHAYDDGPLPIEAGQTISQPFVVAIMIEAAEIAPGDRVLEIGAGSGYAAAVMSRIAAQVYAIERHASLADSAAARLQQLGYANVEVRAGDGTHGWPEAAPFDAIIASAGGPAIPQALKEQLDLGGHLVMPVGDSPRVQRLIKVTRAGANLFVEEDLGAVAFVPLIGAHGWKEEDDSQRGRR